MREKFYTQRGANTTQTNSLWRQAIPVPRAGVQQTVWTQGPPEETRQDSRATVRGGLPPQPSVWGLSRPTRTTSNV